MEPLGKLGREGLELRSFKKRRANVAIKRQFTGGLPAPMWGLAPSLVAELTRHNDRLLVIVKKKCLQRVK
jgi:hypothetical protein